MSGEVTAARLAELMTEVAGPTVDVGPLRAGPGGVARVVAHGRLGRADVRPAGGGPPVTRYDAVMPAELELTVQLPGGRCRFDADVQVRVHAVVTPDGDGAAGAADADGRAADSQGAVIDLRPLTPGDVTVRVRPYGLQARLLARVADLEGEVRRQVADYVNTRLTDEDVQSRRRIRLP